MLLADDTRIRRQRVNGLVSSCLLIFYETLKQHNQDNYASCHEQVVWRFFNLFWQKLFISPYPGPKVIKLFSFSSQLSMKIIMKIIMLINAKMPTIVGILTFKSMINTRSESLKARKVFIFQHFTFMSS